MKEEDMSFNGLWQKLIGTKTNQPSATILVVDDSETDRTFINRLLTKKGYKILSAENGQTALQMAKGFLPDLIVLDYMLPDISGPEVCKTLKSLPATQNIPVIFLTSLDTPVSVIECFKEGADIFLSKPVKTDELLQQIKLSLFVQTSAKKESG